MKEKDRNRIIYIDRRGWPIESWKGHRFNTILRRIMLTRKIERYEDFYKRTRVVIKFN